jgi:RecA/RadA recombinase
MGTSSKSQAVASLKETFGVRKSELTNLRMPVGISAVDSLIQGLPAGAITEIFGPHSSGRTTVMLSALATASRENLCALVDSNDTFDVVSACKARIKLDNLLWVRCSSIVDRALKATEILLRSNLFSLVVLDLGNVLLKDAKRIPQGDWLRFRRAIEDTNNAFLVIGQQSMAQSLAGLVIEMQKEKSVYTSDSIRGTSGKYSGLVNLMTGFKLKVRQRRPFAVNAEADFDAMTRWK